MDKELRFRIAWALEYPEGTMDEITDNIATNPGKTLGWDEEITAILRQVRWWLQQELVPYSETIFIPGSKTPDGMAADAIRWKLRSLIERLDESA